MTAATVQSIIPEATTSWALDVALVRRLVALATAGGAAPVETFAPASGRKIADLPQSSIEDLDRAFATSRAAATGWVKTPVKQRAAIVRKFHDLVLRQQSTLLDIVQTETGKARHHAYSEVSDVAVNCRYYAKVAPGLLADHTRSGAVPVLTQVTEKRIPKGVVAVISPWNYPLALTVSDALPALIAGNGVVARPDNQTALVTLYALELAREAGLPEGLWQVVLGRGSAIGGEIIARADYVDYTGSTSTGRTIAQQAAARLIGCSLELGGKNPMLVLADANAAAAAKNAISACFSSAGQLCESIERIYVHDKVYDRFVSEFVARTKRLKLGADLSYNSDMGSLTFERQFNQVSDHVRDAVSKGALVLAGGKARPEIGPYFYEPTILTGVTSDMTLHREETFGPVVAIYPVNSDEEAIALANDTHYGLNASVWSGSVSHGQSVAAQIHAGSVNVNEGYIAAWGSIDAPSGGLGDSGMGRRHGTAGLLKYVDSQTIATQRVLPIAPLPGMSEQLWATTMTVALAVMRRVGLK